VLQDYLAGLRDARLEPEKVALLRRPVEARLQVLKTMKARRDFEGLQKNKKETFEQFMSREAKAEQHKREQVAELMQQYHKFFHDAKYKDAEAVAMRAHELDPDDAAASAAVAVARLHRNKTDYDNLKANKEDLILNVLNGTDDEGPVVNPKNP